MLTEVQSQNWGAFLEGALSIADAANSLAIILLGFSVLTLLQVFGIRQNEIGRTFKTTTGLFWVIVLACATVVTGFVIRMSIVGHHYEIANGNTVDVPADVASIGWWITMLAIAQLLLVAISLFVCLVWVWNNREVSDDQDTSAKRPAGDDGADSTG